LTALPDGNSHFTLASVEDISVVLDDPSQPTYTGKTTFTEGSNLNPQNNCTFTNAAYFVLKGTDGSMVSGSRWCMSPCSRTALPPSSSTGFGCTARSGSADPVGRGALASLASLTAWSAVGPHGSRNPWSPAGTSGHQRSSTVRRNCRSPAVQLTQLG
jgi:hypothetical protein